MILTCWWQGDRWYVLLGLHRTPWISEAVCYGGRIPGLGNQETHILLSALPVPVTSCKSLIFIELHFSYLLCFSPWNFAHHIKQCMWKCLSNCKGRHKYVAELSKTILLDWYRDTCKFAQRLQLSTLKLIVFPRESAVSKFND